MTKAGRERCFNLLAPVQNSELIFTSRLKHGKAGIIQCSLRTDKVDVCRARVY